MRSFSSELKTDEEYIRAEKMTTQEIKREFESHEERGQICRLCMSEESLDDVLKDDHLTEWIWELLAIKISGDDRMSQVICTICRIRLTEFHQFRMGCHEVQEVLLALIPDATANTPVQCDICFENQKDIETKFELVENDELELQGSGRITSFEKAGISSHRQDEEMKNDLFDVEDYLVVEEIKIETPADDEVVDSAESQDNKINIEEVYRCDICQNVYSNIMQLKKHKNYHTRKLKKQVNKVNEEIPEDKDLLAVSNSSSNLKKENSKDRIHHCDECPKTYLTRKHLCMHKQCHKPKKYFCHVCERPFHARAMLKRHLVTHTSPAERQQAKPVRDIENAPRPHKCDICKKAFMDKSTLRQHSKFVHGPKKFECEICGFKFADKKKLKSHMRKHVSRGHTKEDFRAVKKLSQQNDGAANQNDDDEISDRSSVPSDNETNENDKAHKEPSKSDENSSELPAGQPFQCDVCHEGFETTVHLDCHKRFICRQQKNMHKHHKPKSTSTKHFECPECRKIWPSWKSLYNHVRNSHVRKKTLPKDRTVGCPKCDKMFQTAPQRDLHMRRVHTTVEHNVQLWQHIYNQHGEKSASSDSEDTTDESDLEDSVQNSNEESTKPLEGNATVEEG